MMDIVFCTDNNYVMPCGIAMISLFENNSGENITIHIIGMDLNETSKANLKEITDKYNSNISFYNIEEDYLNRFNFAFRNKDKHANINIAAYIRLFVSEILSEDIDIILYVDSDVLVTDDISDLWNISLDHYSLGGVIDDASLQEKTYLRVGYPKKFGYINSGVLFINLKFWRDNEVFTGFIEYEKKNHDKIEFHDQDIINGVLYSSILHLPLKYNMHGAFYLRKKVSATCDKEIEEIRKKPAIIHFTHPPKPWNKGSFHPKRATFLKYKNLSIWKDIPIEWQKGISLGAKMKYYKRLVLYSFRLKKTKYVNL